MVKLSVFKLLSTFNDGTFSWYFDNQFREPYNKYKLLYTGIFRELYTDNGSYRQYLEFYLQSIWSGILLLNSMFLLYNPINRKLIILALTIIGAAMFHIIFEARARYLLGFIPIIFILTALNLNNILNWRIKC